MNPLTYKQKFCKRLQMLRKRAGYKTQYDLADALGISRSTYVSYESRFLMPLHLMPLVCELLNCGPWMLLTGQSDQFAPPLENGDRPYHIDQPIRFATARIAKQSDSPTPEENNDANSEPRLDDGGAS